METSAVAYSYIRFSNPAQVTGDSLRRQTESARNWCMANGYRLDESTTLRDLGASAYVGTHRSNPDRYALAGFLRLVEEGKVPRGSALLVESLDRLTREHIRPALTLILNLIEAGVRLVQLQPVEAIYDEKVEPMALMMAIMELSRGHSESAVKSERIMKAYQEKKKQARKGDHLYTAQVPAWVRITKSGMGLIPERAKVVKAIFDLSANGYGLTALVGKLVADKVPPFGKSKLWKRTYIANILKDRRALGEFQPHYRDRQTGRRIPDGEPIPDYFPVVVTEKEYHAARASAESRKNHDLKPSGKGGKKRKRKTTERIKQSKRHTTHANVNLFTGLIVSARDPEDKYQAVQRVESRSDRTNGRQWVLLNRASAEGRAKCVSFPLVVFEHVIIGQLQEIDPRSILGTDGGHDEVLALAGERAEVDTKIAALELELMSGDVPSIARTLRVLEGQRKELVQKEADARAQAAVPTAAAWGEAKPLLAALKDAPDQEDTRRRLRAALRRIVQRITLLIVPRGRSRIAAVRVDFEGGKHRDYIITHTPPHYSYDHIVPGRFEGGSEAWSDEAGELDIRKPEDAEALERILAKRDVSKLADTIAAANTKRKSAGKRKPRAIMPSTPKKKLERA